MTVLEGVEHLIFAQHLKKFLSPALRGGRVHMLNVTTNNQKILKFSKIGLQDIVDKEILSDKISVFGKYIILPLSDNMNILFVFGQSGVLSAVKTKYTQITFEIGNDSGVFELHYDDMRHFSNVTLYSSDDPPNNLCISTSRAAEWREPDIGKKLYVKICRRRKAFGDCTIKKFIMDPLTFAGVGNFYACEGLFLSNMHPAKPISKVSKREIISLCQNVQNNMIRFYKHGGYPQHKYLIDDYESAVKRSMVFTYKRQGNPCRVCQNAVIQRVKFAGSSVFTYYCPVCQR